MPYKAVDIDIDRDQWESIIEDVEKVEVPVQCLKRITIKLENGKRRQISISKLRNQGLPDEQIENMLNQALTILGDEVKNVDFIVDVDLVAKMVTPQTREILALLKKNRK